MFIDNNIAHRDLLSKSQRQEAPVNMAWAFVFNFTKRPLWGIIGKGFNGSFFTDAVSVSFTYQRTVPSATSTGPACNPTDRPPETDGSTGTKRPRLTDESTSLPVTSLASVPYPLYPPSSARPTEVPGWKLRLCRWRSRRPLDLCSSE